MIGLAALICGGLVAGASAGAQQAIPCDLTLKLGSRSGSPSTQSQLDLVFVNNDVVGATCRLSGYPDVELIGPVVPALGSIDTLPRQSAAVESVTLRVGQSAHAVLTWLPPSPPVTAKERWTPGYIRVVVQTNRGLSLPVALPWRYGPVLRQDGATHPGTFIGPIRPGA